MPPLAEHLLEFAEGFDFEVKAGQGADGKGELPKDFWKTYSAFANTSGGIVFLGIKEPKRGRGTSYRFPGMGERQIKDEEASLFPVSQASQSVQSSTHLEASSTQNGVEKDAHLLELAGPIRNTGRADPALTRSVILALCKDAFLTGQQISELLGRNSGSIQERFLRPLVREKKLILLYPHSPNHEQQAYKASDTP